MDKEEVKKTILARIKINPDTGCHEWTGSRNKVGYGRFSIVIRKMGIKKTWMAHRLSYFVFVGDIPDGLFVLHRCDNPCCVNVDHLFLGTHQDNMDDRTMKGRTNHLYGSKNPPSKLTEETVKSLRREKRKRGFIKQKAEELGVNRSTIARALKGYLWQHVKDD
jgi:hypothetical protein